MENVVREKSKREEVEAVTIIETPPVIVVGVVGYIKTFRGLCDECRRRFYKNWLKGKKKAFTKNSKTWEFGAMKKYCSVTRVIVHPHIRAQISATTLIRRRGLLENHTFILEPLYLYNRLFFLRKLRAFDVCTDMLLLFYQSVVASAVFHGMCLLDKMIDFIGVSKGHGVNKSWHTKKLARKTHKRLEEGGLHWSLASFSCGIHGRSCRADRRSSPHGDQQGLLSSKKKDTKIYLKIKWRSDTTSKFGHWCFLTVDEKRAFMVTGRKNLTSEHYKKLTAAEERRPEDDARISTRGSLKKPLFVGFPHTIIKPTSTI
uniref:Ribosomal protein L3 like n=1 Tax=Oryzias latipes TaxID=8090 RepID=A0A3B3H9W4_ORYLA